MFRIQLYESRLGPSATSRLVQNNLVAMPERMGAVKYIEDYIAHHDHSGYDGRQDSWWCRNDGDEVVKTLIIRSN